MVSPISATNEASGASAADALSSATSANSALGKDAFLKLLVAQMSNQDPLKPMDDTAFVAQLAQFSSLEQTIGINKRLDDLATQERGMANTQIASLVGKTVTVKGTITTLDSSGIGAPISFNIGDNASSVSVNIVDGTGKVVRTMQLGAKPAGLTQVSWDGRDDNGLSQPPGPYGVTVSAKDANGATVDVLQETSGTLVGVDFQKGYPNLRLDNGVSAPASDLIRIHQGK